MNRKFNVAMKIFEKLSEHIDKKHDLFLKERPFLLDSSAKNSILSTQKEVEEMEIRINIILDLLIQYGKQQA